MIGGSTTAAVAAPTVADATSAADSAQVQAIRSGAPTVPGQYIVTLKEPAGARAASTTAVVKSAAARAQSAGAQIRHQFTGATTGYSATLSAAELALVRQDPAVASVQPNHVYRTSGTTEVPKSWGLDRVDERTLPLDNKYYRTATGKGVTAFVVDSGMVDGQTDLDHVAPGVNLVTADDDPTATNDCLGHGTHVAGTIGGTDYGVAKEVTLVPIRVFGCEDGTTTETILAGLDAVLKYEVTGPRVVNMSLGYDGIDTDTDAAVKNLVDAGIPVVLAAGNGDRLGNGVSACSTSPARVKSAITVGATTKTDKRATFSNYGSCVDLYAPGYGIKSDWLNKAGKAATLTLDGTSMAAPHVTGAVAMYLERHPTATPAQVQAALISSATKDKVTNVSSKWPRLLLLALQKAVVPAGVTTGNKLRYNESLVSGNTLCSSNAVYCLGFDSAGTLQLKKVTAPKKTVWTAAKGSAWIRMTSTGALSSYDAYGRRVWTSGKTGGQATLYVISTGYLKITRDSDDKTLWSSRS